MPADPTSADHERVRAVVCGGGYDPTDTFPADTHRAVKSDWVVSATAWYGGQSIYGLVLRVARDGSWLDVRWRADGQEWNKRMRSRVVLICCEVPMNGGWWVMDVTRHKELIEQREVAAIRQGEA